MATVCLVVLAIIHDVRMTSSKYRGIVGVLSCDCIGDVRMHYADPWQTGRYGERCSLWC